MKRSVMSIVSAGLVICCLTAPLSVFAAQPPTCDDPAVTSENPPAREEYKADNNKKLKVNVDALVDAKIISKETGVQVKAYLKEYNKELKAERDHVKKMKEEDRQIYYERKYPYGKPDIWLDMAAAGIVTLDEANAIKDFLLDKS